MCLSEDCRSSVCLRRKRGVIGGRNSFIPARIAAQPDLVKPSWSHPHRTVPHVRPVRTSCRGGAVCSARRSHPRRAWRTVRSRGGSRAVRSGEPPPVPVGSPCEAARTGRNSAGSGSTCRQQRRRPRVSQTRSTWSAFHGRRTRMFTTATNSD